jgi:purine nucleosidase
MLRLLLIVLVFMTVAGCARVVPNVIIDHDGGVDDLIAIALLIKSGAVHVRAITICPGDSYLENATRATQLFVDRLGGENITIAQGHSEGTNPFPAAWRKDAGRVLTIPALSGVQPGSTDSLVSDDAAHHLSKLLSRSQRFTILETGPLTNIADALKVNPSIKNNIDRIYVMGGAVRVKGNVEQPGYDGSAEWNIFNQPQAAADVVRSGIPITLIPLDATNKVPLKRSFIDRLGMQASISSQLAAQAWHVAAAQEGTDQYYFWDTLTAAAMLDRGLVTIESLKIKVITEGVSQGRTVEDPNGTPIEVAVDANQKKVEGMFLEVFN